jgi:hypothetical protein
MADTGSWKVSLKRRISDELMEFLVTAAYLYVCFTAVTYFRFAVLEAQGIPFAPFGFAAAKAFICAKFMSMGHMVRLGDRYKNRALIWPVLHKTFAFLLLLLVLNAAEEMIVGLLHARPIMASLAEVSGGTYHLLIARSVMAFLILLPFFALRELGDVVGGRTLARLFFVPRHGTDHAALTITE